MSTSCQLRFRVKEREARPSDQASITPALIAIIIASGKLPKKLTRVLHELELGQPAAQAGSQRALEWDALCGPRAMSE